MGEIFKGKKFKILACVVAALMLGTVFASLSHNGTSPIASVLSAAFSPIEKFSSYVAEITNSFAINFRSSATYSERIKELESEVEKYQVQLVEFEQAKQKIAVYEEFLDVKEENPDYELEDASIIARDSADMYYSFVISKGSNSGIEVNDPVIYGKHLVGVVSSVKANTAVVKTILDPELNAGAYDIQSREYGYVTTNNTLSAEEKCMMPGLKNTTSITSGSVICTSGIGGIYPKDLIIGTVDEVLNDTQTVSVYAVIKPGVKIADLQEVFVIKDFDGQGVTTTD
ncbi:MAG: rod shape-determining protein MreC [Ruminococcaceae bacterium]|nr:rod shape-determining protein MreC [Oscillospiraceae bacterium]